MHVAGTASARVTSHLGHGGRALGAVLAGGRQPAAALARVMSVAGPIPALASASVLQSAPVGGSVVGVVGPL